MDVGFLFLSKTHPFEGGGAELRTWELAKRFAKYGSQTTILTSEIGAPPSRPESIEGVRFEYLPSTRLANSANERIAFLAPRIQFFLSRSPLLVELITEGKPDLVHDDITPFPTIQANRLCGEVGIPEVATIHILRGGLINWLRVYGPVGIGGAIGEALLRGRLLRYSHILTDSQWLRDDLLRNLDAQQVSWIPNGVDTDAFQPREQVSGSSRDSDSVRFLFVGRFIGWKGHRVLVESFAKLLRGGAQATLMLVGTGPNLPTIQSLCVNLRIENHVAFLGWIPHTDMPSVYQKADVFVLPSAAEGLSVALIEAMSAGLPVIASDFPGNRDVLGESAALYVRHGDFEGFTAAMTKLVHAPDLRAQLGRAGRKKVVENYSWDRVARSQFKIFMSFVEG